MLSHQQGSQEHSKCRSQHEADSDLAGWRKQHSADSTAHKCLTTFGNKTAKNLLPLAVEPEEALEG